jgi:hypothetical protein
MKKDMLMKRGSTIFLRLAVITFGLIVLALCIFVVPSISRGIGIELPWIAYMQYPFVIAMYGSAIVFYIAIYHAFKLLNYIDTNSAFSDLSVRALKHIKRCALVITILFSTTLPLFFNFAQADDAPGVVLIGMAITAIPFIVTVLAAILEMLLKNAIDIKRENELTV